MSTLPISDYALLSDRHSVALVSRGGSVDWLCFPRFDSNSVFAAILGEGGGNWSIHPQGPCASSRRYLDGTMVLETTFRTDSGEVTLTDAMEVGETPDPHRLGEGAPHALLRSLTCTSGSMSLDLCFKPRPEYGLIVPVMTSIGSGILASGGSGRLLLSCPEVLHAEAGELNVTLELHEGESLNFALQYSSLADAVPSAHSQSQTQQSLLKTVAAWHEWTADHQSYEGPWRDLVLHSGRVLQALSYQPTGAIVAAATTSLPELEGGERNWDYRYSWVRDASFTLQALWVAACPEEAEAFFAFVTAAAAHSGPSHPLQIMFGVGGEHDLTERVLPQLAGWRDSRPVRVGNGAWNQTQLDVYGEILDAAFRLRDQLGDIPPEIRGFLANLADAAATQWRQTDNGIWEIRGEPQHFLYSKLMCWVALDRAIKMAEQLQAQDRVQRWSAAAEEVRTAILEQGWNPKVGAFTQHFGSDSLDAAALMLPIVGFLPGTDPKILSTIAAVEEQLVDDRGLVLRYRTQTGIDGLPGEEGSFLLCTFWLAETLAMAGRTADAREVFERAARYLSDVGLLAEEIDTETGQQMGNFPQAFSHIGLINAAWAIQQAAQNQLHDEQQTILDNVMQD
ncbi:glycoside hydrolase family 15 protein [Arthrobacter globiformis]|uniref:glycoside hydrolase family 15 protein n=1 Tax=Arthrobacter globiformis TaxID=1665 RepID=UPI002787E9C5|nr:glycoside hydrolase family 15 protein [Arthrobacter globiformis]MDQ0867501.1 GH15 family glucan-1,4-alpha-glucosidase [Arthrobacter globiformis]